MLFGQCPHGGVNKLKGASLKGALSICFVSHGLFWWASIIITENCNFIKSFFVFRKLIFSFTLAAESFLRKRLLPSLHFFADTDLALISCEREELENARSAC